MHVISDALGYDLTIRETALIRENGGRRSVETANVTPRIDKQAIPFEQNVKSNDSAKPAETELLVDQLARILTSDDARRRISKVHEGVVPKTCGLRSIEEAKRLYGQG